MKDLNENPLAFPVHPKTTDPCEEGMRLRDYFAAKAMQGMISDPATLTTLGDVAKDKETTASDVLASLTYGLADAMLKERLKTK